MNATPCAVPSRTLSTTASAVRGAVLLCVTTLIASCATHSSRPVPAISRVVTVPEAPAIIVTTLPSELTRAVPAPVRPIPLPECAPKLCNGQLVTLLGDYAHALRQANRMLACIEAWQASRGSDDALAELTRCAALR